MTVVNYLIKKEKVYTCVFKILFDLYGKPHWISKPREGQDREAIFQEWINELGDYDEVDLRSACYALFKYNKCKTFPSLSHVISILYDNIKTSPVSNISIHRSFCIENEFFERDCKLGRPFYMISHYRRAVRHILEVLLPEAIGMATYREIELFSEEGPVVRGKKYQKAMELGLFSQMDNLLWQSKNGGL